MIEEWRPVPGWEDFYEASTEGRIRSLARAVLRGGRPMKVAERVLKPSVHHSGYRRVILARGGDRDERLVHSVIALTFHGPRPDGMEVRHLNGDQTDNRPSNLAYGTSGENKADILEHGRHPLKNRTHCPIGHELSGTNLVAWESKRGHRKCRSCAAAHSKMFRHPHLREHFQEVADSYYMKWSPK